MTKSAVACADLVTFTEEILNGKLHFLCNVGQNIVDKFTRLNKVDLSVECFRAVFFAIFQQNCPNLSTGWPAGCSPSIQVFQGFSQNFLNS